MAGLLAGWLASEYATLNLRLLIRISGAALSGRPEVQSHQKNRPPKESGVPADPLNAADPSGSCNAMTMAMAMKMAMNKTIIIQSDK